jgi:O-methyltransferase
LHLFDAFQGIYAPDPALDGDRALKESQKFGSYVDGETVTLTGIYDSFGGNGTVDACKDVIINKVGYAPVNVHFHIGWFKDVIL